MIVDYWNRNPLRWKRCLIRAAGLADMFELRRPDVSMLRGDEPNGLTLLAYRDGMFWNTTHKRFERSSLSGVGDHADPLLSLSPDQDAPTCFACICGILRELHMVTSPDIRYILGVSAGRQTDGWTRWRSFSEDYRVMMRGLSGDLAKPAMRDLVLGNGGRKR